MSRTIAEAAAEVLRSSNNSLSVEEIVAQINERSLYNFNSSDQISIVREQIRRHCFLPGKTLQYEPVLFVSPTEGKYKIMTDEYIPKKGSFRRVRRARDKEDVIEKLAKKGDSIFSDIWKLLVFACALGLSQKRRVPVADYDTGRSIDFTYFSGATAWPGIIHLIGLVESLDPHILNPEQDKMDLRIQLFEEYANGGLEIMREEMESRDFNLDSLVVLLPLRPSESAIDGAETSTQI
jgi:dnd system-associated protein 4